MKIKLTSGHIGCSISDSRGIREYETINRASLKRIADRVLDAAQLTTAMTIADIGSGDGLLTFSAIDRIGPSLRSILVDISIPLLRHAEKTARKRGVSDQCTFHHGSAEHLKDIPDASVDVIMTRAVLAYVSNKPAALKEFYRVLKPGGRLSIAEPILQDDAMETIALRKLLDNEPATAQNRFLSIAHRWKAAQFPDTQQKLAECPLSNYSERDLVRFVQQIGFAEIHMAFLIDIFPSVITSWEVFLNYSPHPWAPSVGKILAEQCTEDERQIFEDVLRPNIESARISSIERVAYITAVKNLS